MSRKGSEGNSSESRGNRFNLYPVSAHESGEGLPYAPEGWPSPGDKWGWKVGSRLGNYGYYRDRNVFPPLRLCENGPKIVFRSRVSLKEYIRENFPDADVDAIVASFSWKIPSEESKKGAFRHTEETAEAPDSDARVIVARCKARNRYCSTLAQLEGSVPGAISCDICCSEPRFCRICCCIICCRPINEACGTYDYIRCRAKIGGGTCGHICHFECALQSYMAGTVGESSTGLNAEYYCRRCDSKTDLVAHFAELLQSCESVVVPRYDVEKILEVGIRVLQGSKNGSAMELLQRIQIIKSKVLSSSSSSASQPLNVSGVIQIESPRIMGPLGHVYARRGTKLHDPEPIVETDAAPDEDSSMDVDPMEVDTEHSSDDAGDESFGQSSTPGARRHSQSDNIPRLVRGDAAFNALRFHSRQERSRYTANRRRGIIPDKGFSQADMQSPLVQDAIESRGWEEFVRHPNENSSWELVREFYANAGYNGTSTSKVRGYRIQYSADAIDNFFRVRATPRGQNLLAPLRRGDTGPALKRAVLELLCEHSGPQWIDASRPTRIRGLHMDVPNVQWWKLHRSKISPSSHLDDPNAEHVYPVYCIMKGLPLNIGEIIESDITHRATNPKVSLAHPHLILELCHAAGVQMEEFDMDFKIGPPIRFPKISVPSTPSARMIHLDDLTSEAPRSESPQSLAQATSQQTEAPPCHKRKLNPPMEGSGGKAPSSISLWDIHEEMREMNSRLDTLTTRIDCNGYSIDRLQARVELFLSRAAEQLGIQFPPPAGDGPDC